MTNIDLYKQAKSAIDDFFTKTIQKAMEAAGKDIDNFEVSYFSYSDGTQLTVRQEPKSAKKYMISTQKSDKRDNYIGVFIDDNFSRFYGDSETGECYTIPKKIDSFRMTKTECDNLSNYLNNLSSQQITYDKTQTNSGKKVPQFARDEFIRKFKELGLNDVGEYPTIQVTVTFWALLLADYLALKKMSYEEIREKLIVFKKYLNAFLANQMMKNGTKTYINLEDTIRDYELIFRPEQRNPEYGYPLLTALRAAGISLDDFVKNKKLLISAPVTTATTEGYATIQGRNIEYLCSLPKDVYDKLEEWAIRLIIYARNNDRIPEIKIYTICYYYLYPIIKDILDSGDMITVDEQRLYDIFFNCDDLWTTINEAIKNEFAHPKHQENEQQQGGITPNA